jgi:hypothetical protein
VTAHYRAGRGGHAPGHLREAFCAWLERPPRRGALSDTFEMAEGDERPADWLLGQLWHCTDALPGGYCHQLGISPGSTYAQAARHLRPLLRGR